MKRLFSTLLSMLISCYSFSQQIKIIENRYLKSKAGKWGLTDSLDKTIVPFLYDRIEFENGRLIVRKKNLHGLLTIDNDLLIPIEYTFILSRANNRFILWSPKSQWGMCDNNGKIIIPVKYKSVSSTENDEYYITRNEKDLNGAYRFTGENVLPEIYQFYTLDGNKVFTLKEKQPLIVNLDNTEEKVLLDRGIVFIETVVHGSMGEQFFQMIKKQNKFGLINSENQIIIPLIYDEISSSQHWRYYIVKQNGKVGIINVNGKMVKEPVYDVIELRKEYVLLKRKNQQDEIYNYEW